MKRRLKLTPFAKIFIVAIIVLGVRYVYKNQNNIFKDNVFKIETIKEKIPNLFKSGVDNKNEVYTHKNNSDTITIFITDDEKRIKISSEGKILNYRKFSNKTDTILFNISNEKKIVGKIIYKKNKWKKKNQ